MPDGNETLDLWSRACHAVLDQSGRARMHDTRAALNSIALGLEVLRHEVGDRGANAPRVLDIMHRDLMAAADELSGLHSLLTALASDRLTRLSAALEWADLVARPVARRYGVDLETPAPGSVPGLAVDRRLALGVALVLIEATLSAPRGGRCTLRVSPSPGALEVEWSLASGKRGSDEVEALSERFLDLMPGTEHQLSENGDRRALRIGLSRAA